MADPVGNVVPQISIIRRRDGTEQRATFFELFFDLVYVFAVTQLSHHLLTHFTWEGAAQTAFMLIAVYWVWNYTTWMANWFDPETTPVRLVLSFIMLVSLLMAVAIPDGFDEHALLFACCYVAMQIGRNAFIVAVTPKGSFNQNFRQILAWAFLSAPLWIVGGIADDARWLLWLTALGLDLAAPLVMYWLPRVGSTPSSHWQLEGHHFAERFQLFLIIAFGETVVLTGATAAGHDLTLAVVITLCLALLSATALWWLYFGGVAEAVRRRISTSSIEETGALGRDIFTYLHLPIIAGIVLTAVSDELVIAHPSDDLGVAGAIVTLSGPALFLLGLAACVIRVGKPVPWPLALTALAMLAAIPLAKNANGLVVSAVVVAVLIALVLVENRPSRRKLTQQPS